jgi:nucleotide-binding universal stress UspA family protein
MGDSDYVIVVGVDGSEHARQALDWAVTEAALRGGRCLLVRAHDVGLDFLAVPHDSPLKVAAAVLDRDVAAARKRGCVAEGRVVVGSPARVLIDASDGADLLVVGTRGRGAVTGALLGSVSTACVHHARCPVVVVPPPRRRDGAVSPAAASG